jgi:hypothetical protein
MKTRVTEKKILVIGSRSFLSLGADRLLKQMGVCILGPMEGNDAAEWLRSVAALDAAIVDAEISEQDFIPVIEQLESRNIPFLFALQEVPFANFRGFALTDRVEDLDAIFRVLFETDTLH